MALALSAVKCAESLIRAFRESASTTFTLLYKHIFTKLYQRVHYRINVSSRHTSKKSSIPGNEPATFDPLVAHRPATAATPEMITIKQHYNCHCHQYGRVHLNVERFRLGPTSGG